jgi:hypothetical protein
MNREIHVRFWESAGVRLPCATQQSQQTHASATFALNSIGSTAVSRCAPYSVQLTCGGRSHTDRYW